MEDSLSAIFSAKGIYLGFDKKIEITMYHGQT